MRNKLAQRAIVPWQDIDDVILDMDGTLLDLHFDTQVWNHLLPQRFAEQEGLDLTSAREEVAQRLDDARGTLQWYCLDHWHERLGIDIADLEVEMQALVTLRRGTSAFLNRLAGQGKRLILATNAHPSGMQRKFALTGIDQYFDVTVSSHEFDWCKEAQQFWLNFQRQVDFDPRRTIFIDDNHAVLNAAFEFGIAYLFGIEYPDSSGPAKISDEFHCLGDFEELFGP